MSTFDQQRFVRDARELATHEVVWRHLGQDPATGLDCLQLVRYLYRLQGLEFPAELDAEFETYHPSADGVRLFAMLRKWAIEIDPIHAMPGDLYLMRGKDFRHLAIRVSDDHPPFFVEAYRGPSLKNGKLMDWQIEKRRLALTVGIFRIPAELDARMP